MGPGRSLKHVLGVHVDVGLDGDQVPHSPSLLQHGIHCIGQRVGLTSSVVEHSQAVSSQALQVNVIRWSRVIRPPSS